MRKHSLTKNRSRGTMLTFTCLNPSVGSLRFSYRTTARRPDGDRFRSWARKIGYSTLTVIERVLDSKPIEQQAYKGCMAILSLEKDYSGSALEMACERILAYGITPTYKNILNLLMANNEKKKGSTKQPQGITRGADYYRRNND